jgi:hypothetical protein
MGALAIRLRVDDLEEVGGLTLTRSRDWSGQPLGGGSERLRLSHALAVM